MTAFLGKFLCYKITFGNYKVKHRQFFNIATDIKQFKLKSWLKFMLKTNKKCFKPVLKLYLKIPKILIKEKFKKKLTIKLPNICISLFELALEPSKLKC